MAQSRSAGRQIVRNGHVLVNAKKVNIPSFSVKEGDVVTIKAASAPFVAKIAESIKERISPPWLSIAEGTLEGKVVSMPRREDIDALIDERLIVEFYSR